MYHITPHAIPLLAIEDKGKAPGKLLSANNLVCYS